MDTNNTATELTHTQVAAAVRRGFSTRDQYARAGRVVSGLLKAAVKAGKLKTRTHCGRVSGYCVWYVGTQDAFDSITAEAARRLS